MRKSLSLIAAALTVAVVVPSLAGAAARHHKCSFNLTIRSATVKSTGSPPTSGTQTDGGIIDGKLCSKQFRGASRGVVTFTGAGKSTAAGSFFGPWGSYQTSGSFAGAPNPDGSVTITGSGKITGGTGLYRGATGSFSATGTRAPSGVFTFHYTGTITY